VWITITWIFLKNYNGTGDIPDQDSCVSKWAGCINRWAPFFFFGNRGGEIEEESLCASVVIPVCKSRCRMSEATFFFLGLHHDEMAPPGKEKINR